MEAMETRTKFTEAEGELADLVIDLVTVWQEQIERLGATDPRRFLSPALQERLRTAAESPPALGRSYDFASTVTLLKILRAHMVDHDLKEEADQVQELLTHVTAGQKRFAKAASAEIEETTVHEAFGGGF
ncbi:MAG: hypothetical protein AAGN66_27970 [Acidobacteriota bacterium]